MSLLSLYSKIQLKIKKAEGELRWLHSVRPAGGPVEPECGTLQKGSTALKGQWSQQLFKLRLLFYKTAKIIVRFFALLFGDSSENFLMFASEAKGWLHSVRPAGGPVEPKCKTAKRLHSPKGTMEPAMIPCQLTFICNNSFCQCKRFQKRVRFCGKTAFVGILICAVIVSSILYFMAPGKSRLYSPL